jgi:hypothetical protein
MVQTGDEINSVSSDNGIAVTSNGIRKLLPQLAHNILFVGACNSFSTQPKAVKDGFMTTPIEYLGYADKCHSGPVSRDTTTFFRRLAGLEFDEKAREVGRHSILFSADGECTAFGRGGFSSILRHDGPGKTTVAPIVAWVGISDTCQGGDQAFSPKNQTFEFVDQLTVNGHVTFDTVMDTTKNPIKVLTTDGGTCLAQLKDVKWADDNKITFKVVLKATGDFELRVHNDSAISLHNGRELDGNQNPRPFLTNGVGPNRDDYVAKNKCRIKPTPTPMSTPMPAPKTLSTNSLNLNLSILEIRVGAPGTLTLGSVELTSAFDF